jgi:hypothetical protein
MSVLGSDSWLQAALMASIVVAGFTATPRGLAQPSPTSEQQLMDHVGQLLECRAEESTRSRLEHAVMEIDSNERHRLPEAYSRWSLDRSAIPDLPQIQLPVSVSAFGVPGDRLIGLVSGTHLIVPEQYRESLVQSLGLVEAAVSRRPRLSGGPPLIDALWTRIVSSRHLASGERRTATIRVAVMPLLPGKIIVGCDYTAERRSVVAAVVRDERQALAMVPTLLSCEADFAESVWMKRQLSIIADDGHAFSLDWRHGNRGEVGELVLLPTPVMIAGNDVNAFYRKSGSFYVIHEGTTAASVARNLGIPPAAGMEGGRFRYEMPKVVADDGWHEGKTLSVFDLPQGRVFQGCDYAETFPDWGPDLHGPRGGA